MAALDPHPGPTRRPFAAAGALVARLRPPSAIARNSALLLASDAAGRVINLAVQVMLARHLGAAGWGLVGYVTTWGLMAGIVAEFGLTQTAIRRMAAHRDPASLTRALATLRRARAITAAVALTGALAVVLSPLGRDLAASGAGPLLALWLISITLQAFRRNAEAIFQAVENVRPHATLALQRHALAAALLAVMVVSDRAAGATPRLTWVFAAYLAADAVDVWRSRRAVARLLSRLPSTAAGATATDTPLSAAGLLRDSLPFAAHVIVTQAYFFADPLLIKHLARGDTAARDTENGLYAAAYRLAVTPQAIPIALGAALYPALAHAAARHDSDRLAHLFARAVVPLALGGFAVALPLFAFRAEALSVFGRAYAPAAPMLALAVWALPAIFLAVPISALLSATGRQGTVTAASVAAAATSFGLNWLLVPDLGGWATAAVTSISVGLACAVQWTVAAAIMPRLFPWRALACVAAMEATTVAAVLWAETDTPATRAAIVLVHAIIGAGAIAFVLKRTGPR